MGVGSLLALLGLAAAALPILVHLMRQRDLPRRTLPTVALLERATAESRRRFRLRDRLLLALRVLALAAFAIGAARPFVVVHRAFDDQRLASLVVVVDDSMSMARRDGGETLFARARQRAVEAIEGMAEGSEVAVILAGRPARLLVPRTRERALAVRALRALPEESARGTDLAGALDLAQRALAGARHARRLWVLSDFAAHGGLADARLPESGVAVALERLGEAVPPNHAVIDAIAARDPTRPGEASLRILLRGAPDERLTVLAEHEGTELARAEATLDEHGAGSVTLHVPTAGMLGVRVRLSPEDALPTDDRRPVLLQAGAALRVLLVDGDPSPSRTDDEVGFLRHALDALPSERGPVRYRTVDADALSLEALAETDVVVLANVPAPTRPIARALATHVRRGGGLWIGGGSNVAARAYRAAFGDLLPAGLDPAVTVDAPLLPARPGLESARVTRLHALEPRGDATVAVTAGGYPLDVRASRGQGRVAVWASTLDDDWTDVPYHPGFVALVDEVLRDLGAGVQPPPAQVAAGSPVTLPRGSRVRLPSGTVVEPEGALTETAEAGLYVVLDEEDEPRFAFTVAPPAEESELRPAPLPAVNDAGRGSGGGALSRRPIDPWWFLFGGLCLLLESALRLRGPRPVRGAGTATGAARVPASRGGTSSSAPPDAT